ncbi:MAG TPA: tetratricopeptide repeat protein [Kofleriaceae bacterium]|nr:tetratricopeptide repeat protein [Kofleriaceae bacterium]
MSQEQASQLAVMGQQCMQGGMYEQAAQYFAQAIQYAPNVDGLYYHYATACVWRGIPTEAMAALDRCMALRGPWCNHAIQLSAQIRSQMGMQMAMGQQATGMPMGGMMGAMPMQQPMMQQPMMPMMQQPMMQQPMMPMMQQPMMPAPMPAAAPAPAPAPEKKKKKGVGWGVAALGIVGAVALGGAIGTGALDGVAKEVF